MKKSIYGRISAIILAVAITISMSSVQLIFAAEPDTVAVQTEQPAPAAASNDEQNADNNDVNDNDADIDVDADADGGDAATDTNGDDADANSDDASDNDADSDANNGNGANEPDPDPDDAAVKATDGDAAIEFAVTFAFEDGTEFFDRATMDYDLLAGVSAVDENENPVDVTVQDAGGFALDDPDGAEAFTVTYIAQHPESGEAFTATREVYLTMRPVAFAALNVAEVATYDKLAAALIDRSVDTIIVTADIQLEQTIHLTRNITFIGANPDKNNLVKLTLPADFNGYHIKWTYKEASNGLNLVLENLHLEGNATGFSNTDHGGIYTYKGSLTLNNCRVTKTAHGTTTGGIFQSYAGTSTITDSDISGNYAHGIHVIQGSLEVDGSTFDGNKVYTSSGYGEAKGAAIYLSNTTNAVVRDSSFTNNAATSAASNYGLGGAIHARSGSLVLENAHFIGNTANAGGAVSFAVENNQTNAGDLTLAIDGCTFSDNKAIDATSAKLDFYGGRGGAILYDNNKARETPAVIVTNTAFTDNTAEKNGGAIHLYQSTEVINYKALSVDAASSFSGNQITKPDNAHSWGARDITGNTELIALHNSLIKATTFTDFGYGYNNLDISCRDPIVVTYDAMGGSFGDGAATDTRLVRNGYDYGDKYEGLKFNSGNFPTAPTWATGGQFIGWYTSPDYTTPVHNITTVYNRTVVRNPANHTLYAKWSNSDNFKPVLRFDRSDFQSNPITNDNPAYARFTLQDTRNSLDYPGSTELLGFVIKSGDDYLRVDSTRISGQLFNDIDRTDNTAFIPYSKTIKSGERVDLELNFALDQMADALTMTKLNVYAVFADGTTTYTGTPTAKSLPLPDGDDCNDYFASPQSYLEGVVEFNIAARRVAPHVTMSSTASPATAKPGEKVTFTYTLRQDNSDEILTIKNFIIEPKNFFNDIDSYTVTYDGQTVPTTDDPDAVVYGYILVKADQPISLERGKALVVTVVAEAKNVAGLDKQFKDACDLQVFFVDQATDYTFKHNTAEGYVHTYWDHADRDNDSSTASYVTSPVYVTMKFLAALEFDMQITPDHITKSNNTATVTVTIKNTNDVPVNFKNFTFMAQELLLDFEPNGTVTYTPSALRAMSVTKTVTGVRETGTSLYAIFTTDQYELQHGDKLELTFTAKATADLWTKTLPLDWGFEFAATFVEDHNHYTAQTASGVVLSVGNDANNPAGGIDRDSATNSYVAITGTIAAQADPDSGTDPNTGGNNGGSSGGGSGGRDTTPAPETRTIEELSVPLADLPGLTYIPDNDIPLAGLPTTGGVENALALLVAAAIGAVVAGIAMLRGREDQAGRA